MDKNKASLLRTLIAVVIGIIIVLIIVLVQNHNKNNSTIDSTKSPSTTNQSSGSTSSGSSTGSTAAVSNGSSSGSQTSGSSTSAPSCFTADQAANEIGQTGCVQFTGYAYTSSKGEMYLDQSLSAPYGFAAYIPAGYSFGPGVLNQYSGQNIDVTGTITSYKGEPQITVTSASQITLAQ